MRDAFVRVLTEEMERNDRIVLITGDLGFGVLRHLWERFPDRMVNAGRNCANATTCILTLRSYLRDHR